MPYKSPESKRQRDRDRRREQRESQGRAPQSPPRVPLEFRVRTARDVLDRIEDQVKAVLECVAHPIDRARCIGYLCGVALRTIEAGDLATRIEALEQLLDVRRVS